MKKGQKVYWTKGKCFMGIYGIHYIWRGAWSDPLLEYKGVQFNYWDILDDMWNDFHDLGLLDPDDESDRKKAALLANNAYVVSFDEWLANDRGRVIKEYLDDCIFFMKEERGWTK